MLAALAAFWAVAVTVLFVREAFAVIETASFPTAGPVAPRLVAYGAALAATVILAATPWRWASFVMPACAFLLLLAIVTIAVAAGPVAGPIAGFCIQLLWAYGAGWLAIRLIGAEESLPNAGFRVLTATGLGFGIQAHAIFVLGLMHALNAPVVGTVMLVGAALALAPLLRDLVAFSLAARPPSRLGPIAAVAVVASFGIVTAVFFLAASPEIYPDPVAKYTAWADAFYADHYLVEFGPLWGYFHLPFQLLSIPGFALGGDTTGKFLPVFFGLASAATLFVAAAKEWGRDTGAVAALLFLSAPLVIWCMGGAQSDLAVVYFALAAFAVVRTAPSEYQPGAYRLAGLLGGFALAMRVSALPFLVGIALALIVAERPRPRVVAEALAFFLLAACPWFILRFVQTGNPVFPLYNNIFRSTTGPPVNDLYNFEMFGFGKGLVNAIRLPFDMTFESGKFVEAAPFGTLGAAVLLALAAPLAAVGRWRRLALWLTPALVGTVAWFFVAQYLRYLLPMLPFICLAAALVLVRPLRLIRASFGIPTTAAITAILAVATAALSFAVVWRIPERLPVDFVFGQESEEAFLARLLPSYPVARYLAAADTTSPGDGNRVLKFDSAQFAVAYSGRPGTESWDYTAQQSLNLPGPEVRVDALLADGYRWVVAYGPSTGYRVGVVGGELDPDFLGPRVVPVFARNGFVLYEIHAAKPPGTPRPISVCEGDFEIVEPKCWQARGTPELSPAPGGGTEAMLPDGSGFGQPVTACPGAVHRITFRARPATLGDVVDVVLMWPAAASDVLREDHRFALTASDSTELAVLSSAPAGASELDLAFYGGKGTVFVDDVAMSALSSDTC